jgi:hypothetical protein
VSVSLPPRHRRAWETRDQDYLRWHWGDRSAERLAHELDRTVAAILSKAQKLGLGAPSRGTTSVSGLAQRTGYEERQILNVARKLKIAIPRVYSAYRKATRKLYRWSALTESQVDRILAFLAAKPDQARVRQETQGAWGERGRGGFMKPPCCQSCSRNDRPHYCKGYCKPCYDTKRPRRPKEAAGEELRVDEGVGGKRARMGSTA